MTLRVDADLLLPGRGDPIRDGSVVMDGGTISFVGPQDAAPPADNATSVPVAMPGLWECHGHIAGMLRPDIESLLVTSTATSAAIGAADLGRTLLGGVTSIREVGGFGVDLAPAVESGLVAGPTIYGAGQVLSTTGGHADIHSAPLDFVHQVEGFGILCDGVPEVLKAVRTNLRKNAKVIKVCASGGVMSEVDHPMHQQFSDEELRAIVEEAARAERVVAAHCHGKAGIMAALRAGVHTIEHGSFLDDEAIDAMLESGAMYVPTRWVVDALLQMEDRMPRYAYEKMVFVADHQANAIKLAISRGVPIAMGTDIFVSGDSFGQNSYELKLLQDFGMTALEAIEAATANGPLTLGPQAPMSGQLREGYDADVIALDFDPLADASGWGDPDRVTHVWKAGVAVKG